MSDAAKPDVPGEDAQSDLSAESQALDVAEEEETVEGLIVLSSDEDTAAMPLAVPSRVLAPAVQTAAVAAGGFVAGAAIVRLISRRHRPVKVERGGLLKRGRRRSGGPASELIQIVGSRSLLVDVHLLGSSAARR